MTYYSSCYSTYAFTAFSASQLSSGGIGCGTTFKMPTYADSYLSVSDNDRSLSGDTCRDENADDSSGQTASISTKGSAVGNGGQIYAESSFWVTDQHGCRYMLIKIEQEGSSGAYYTFNSAYGMPCAGAQLTIGKECDVGSCGVDYSCLGAGPKLELGSVGGRFYTDADHSNTEWNATTNAWEAGVAGAKVELLDSKGAVVATTTTDGYGTYKFCNVTPGDYKIKFYNPDGTEFVQKDVGPNGEDSDANATGVTDRFCIGNNQNLWNVDAGIRAVTPPPGGSCTVIEAEDMCAVNYATVCGSQASGGELVKLTTNRCGGINDGALSTVFKGASGDYTFRVFAQNESDGNSTIVVKVDGVVVGTIRLSDAFPNDGTGSDNGHFSEFTLQGIHINAGSRIQLLAYSDGGEFVRIDKIQLCPGDAQQPERGSIGDTVWFDADRDGIRDDSETGVGNVKVVLVNLATGAETVQTTDANGHYLFSELAAGNYQVRYELPAGGFAFTTADAAGSTEANDSDANALTGTTATITLAEGQANIDVDAGIVEQLGSISGRYFIDANRNDVDDSEAGLGGVGVTLLADLDNDGQIDDVYATALTTATGAYSFTALPKGSYVVRFDADPAGRTFVAKDDPSSHGTDATDSDVNPTTGATDVIVLARGENRTDVDAGVADPHTAFVGDTVWLESFVNGLQDADELGAAGVTVSLLTAGTDGVFGTADDVVERTTTTDSTGRYGFDNLAAGTYAVLFGALAGYGFAAESAAAADALNGDSDARLHGLTDEFVLSFGEHETDIDAGLVLLNRAPEPQADAAHTCANEAVTVDVLANDTDPDSDPLTITAVDGQAIAEGGSVTTAAGTHVKLLNGQLVFDGEEAYASLGLGQKAHEIISYTVSDPEGATASSTVDLGFCGYASVRTVGDLLAGATVTYQIQPVNVPQFGVAYTLDVLSSSNSHIPVTSYAAAYCIDNDQSISLGVVTTGKVLLATEENAASVGSINAANIDSVNWLLNHDQTLVDNGDGNGKTFTDLEVQEAIWMLMNGDTFFINKFGKPELHDDNNGLRDGVELATLENVGNIVDTALLHGEGFVPQDGDIFGLIIDPTSPASQDQPFIIGVPFDCLC